MSALANPDIVLSVENLTIRFGGLTAVGDVSLTIPKGMIYGLIGPNGAGKTTFFNLLTGVYQPTEGKITAYGQSVANKKPYEVLKLGLARTFQNIRLFKNLTVLENILVAIDHNPEFSNLQFWHTIFRTSTFRKQEEAKRHKSLEYLACFNLDRLADHLAKNLPYGDQRKLEMARALATGARLLLLDEPAAGMNGQETASLMETISRVRKHYDLTILLIEHDMKLVMGICQKIAVLDYGIKIAEGSPKEIQRNPKVIEAYLGKGAEIPQ